MFHNRLTTEPTIRIPPAPPAPVTPAGFLACPAALLPVGCPAQWLCQQWLYQRALELAQAVLRPSLLERDLLGVWN